MNKSAYIASSVNLRATRVRAVKLRWTGVDEIDLRYSTTCSPPWKHCCCCCFSSSCYVILRHSCHAMQLLLSTFTFDLSHPTSLQERSNPTVRFVVHLLTGAYYCIFSYLLLLFAVTWRIKLHIWYIAGQRGRVLAPTGVT